MKKTGYQKRFYRDWTRARDLYSLRIIFKESDLEILADKPLDKNFIEERLRLYRWHIENYISKDKRFLTSLKPLAVELRAPVIIKKMGRAARLANVGPMASVAGAIAQLLGRDLLRKGYRDLIIENGGDIFLKTTRTCNIRIYAGRAKFWKGLGLKIKPSDTPVGICTSSGTVGHSLSFGLADAVVILSKDASLADAVATATANRVQTAGDLPKALDFARSVKGILGAVIIFKKNLISWGKVEFTK